MDEQKPDVWSKVLDRSAAKLTAGGVIAFWSVAFIAGSFMPTRAAAILGALGVAVGLGMAGLALRDLSAARKKEKQNVA